MIAPLYRVEDPPYACPVVGCNLEPVIEQGVVRAACSHLVWSEGAPPRVFAYAETPEEKKQ